jgi:PKD repeat protein
MEIQSMQSRAPLTAAVAVGLALAVVISGWAALGPHSGGTATSASWVVPAVVAPRPSSAHVVVAPGYAPDRSVVADRPLPASTELNVVVGLAPADPRGLAERAVIASEAALPIPDRTLSASQASARYGSGSAAVATAEQYFAGFGLRATAHPDGLLIDVSGPASAVGRAFGTTFHEYTTASGRTFFSHPTPAVLPGIAPWTGAFGLGDASPLRPLAVPQVDAGAVASATCGATAVGLTPCTIQKAYQLDTVFAANNTGQGRRIGIVDAYAGEEPQSRLASDLASFSSFNGLPAANVTYYYPVASTVVLNNSSTNPGWGAEEALDLEWAHASAPNASLVMTFSPNSGSGMYFAVDALVAGGMVDVLSMSWGEPDVGTYNQVVNPCTAACNASTDGSYAVLLPVLELAAVEGISSFAASGDCGAADGTAGVSTNFPASTPWVTGVGGTDLTVTGAGGYGSETGWSGNESGASGSGCSNAGGSGGGWAPFPRPAWQTGSGTSRSYRGVPDVAMDAGTPVEFVQDGIFQGVGGTSVGTPIWAGIAALADAHAGRDLGLLNPGLYAILGGAQYASAFHDIRSGNNGYTAGVGWDPVTGIGTPVVATLLPLLTAATVSPGTLRTLAYASPRIGPAPLNATLALTARGGSGSYPIEGFLLGDGNAVLATNATATHTYPTRGAYSVASFVVDSNGSVAVSPWIVLLVGGGRSLTVGLTASTTNPAVGGSVTFTVTVSGGTSPYLTNLSFGDGSSAVNLTGLSAAHAYRAVGAYCAEAVVRDGATPQDGGASVRVGIGVGGTAAPTCGNPTAPLSVVANGTAQIRDAPADFPDLFNVSGGVTAPAGLAPSVQWVSSDPYPSDCGCAIFRTPGNFSVSEFVNDTANGQANASTNVSVRPMLNATFVASTLSGSVPLIVNFSATVTGGYGASAASTHWKFGNGLSATGARAGTTYSTPGEYVAFASVEDLGHGNASEAFLIDAFGPGPAPVGVVGTIAPVVNVSSGTNVTFTDTVVGPPTTVATAIASWNLGNGHAAYGPAVTETYFAPVDALAGNALATAFSVSGPHGRLLFHLPITLPSFFATEAGGFQPAVSALSFDAVVTPASGVTPLTVTANATASGPGGTNVAWQFANGAYGSGTNVTHVYYGAGDFTVVATAYDAFHDEGVRANGVAANPPLTVSGGPNVVSGPAPLTVNFSVAAYGGAGPPYTYVWTFPGGNLSGTTNVTLTFSAVGRYTVTLEVTDQGNASLRTSWSISVGPVPSVAAWEVLVAGGTVAAIVVALVWRRRPHPPFNL